MRNFHKLLLGAVVAQAMTLMSCDALTGNLQKANAPDSTKTNNPTGGTGNNNPDTTKTGGTGTVDPAGRILLEESDYTMESSDQMLVRQTPMEMAWCEGSVRKVQSIPADTEHIKFRIDGTRLMTQHLGPKGLGTITLPSGAQVEMHSELIRTDAGTGLEGTWQLNQDTTVVLSGVPKPDEIKKGGMNGFQKIMVIQGGKIKIYAQKVAMAGSFLSESFPMDLQTNKNLAVAPSGENRISLSGKLTAEVVTIDLVLKEKHVLSIYWKSSNPARAPHVAQIPAVTCPNEFFPPWFPLFLRENGVTFTPGKVDSGTGMPPDTIRKDTSVIKPPVDTIRKDTTVIKPPVDTTKPDTIKPPPPPVGPQPMSGGTWTTMADTLTMVEFGKENVWCDGSVRKVERDPNDTSRHIVKMLGDKLNLVEIPDKNDPESILPSGAVVRAVSYLARVEVGGKDLIGRWKVVSTTHQVIEGVATPGELDSLKREDSNPNITVWLGLMPDGKWQSSAEFRIGVDAYNLMLLEFSKLKGLNATADINGLHMKGQVTNEAVTLRLIPTPGGEFAQEWSSSWANHTVSTISPRPQTCPQAEQPGWFADFLKANLDQSSTGPVPTNPVPKPAPRHLTW